MTLVSAALCSTGAFARAGNALWAIWAATGQQSLGQQTLVSAWLGGDKWYMWFFSTADKSVTTNTQLAFQVAAFRELAMKHSLFLWPTPAR